jgi:hypothetical protein
MLADEELYFETCWDAEAVGGAGVTTVKTRENIERVLQSMSGTAKEAELVSKADPVSEEEPAHAGATVKPAHTPKVEKESKLHASCH